MTIDYLLGNEERKQDTDLSDDEMNVLLVYRSMDDDGKSAVKWVMRQHKPLPSARSSFSPNIVRRTAIKA